MPSEWYCQLMGEEFGPFSPSALREKATAGEIRPDSLVRKGTGGQWVSASRVKGLFDKTKSQTTSGDKLPRSVARLSQLPAPPPLASRDVAKDVTSVPRPLPVSELDQAPEIHDASPPSAGPTRKKTKRRKWIIVGLILLVAIPTYSWARNNGLRHKLKTCESYAVVNADVYYDGIFSTDVVVVDFQDGGSPNARRIDAVHLFLQFAAKLDLTSVRRVVLARSGQHVFYVDASDLRSLADSYDAGGRVWAFNHLPESVRTMSGSRAYSEWTGGWLGVLQKQTEDLNDFIKTWTGY